MGLRRFWVGLAWAFHVVSAAGQVPDLEQVCLNVAQPQRYALPAGSASFPHAIMFVTQFPLPQDMGSRMSAFGHHLGGTRAAGRGGDLWILHPASQDAPMGCLRNLTREAGFGEADNAGVADPEDIQGDNSIAVREPYVHPSGERALFSMVVGAPRSAAELGREFYWQIYEISGIGLEQTPTIRKIAAQPENYNNVSPVYAPGQGSEIVFTSDLPMGGPQNRHLYPPLDEYELIPTVTGLWELDEAKGPASLRMITHNPSGAFTPFVDSFGRLLFVSWDHLQRDIYQFGSNGRYSWNFSDESAQAVLTDKREFFPEPEVKEDPLLDVPHPDYGMLNRHSIKLFFLWELKAQQVAPEAMPIRYTAMEILNHLGRHQLTFFFKPRFIQEGNGLVDFLNPQGRRQSLRDGFLYPIEDPLNSGRYYFSDGQHFQKNGSGRLFYVDAPPGRSADQIEAIPVTEEDYENVGRFRNPLPLSDGTLLAIWTPNTADTTDLGAPVAGGFHTAPNYRFDLMHLRPEGGLFLAEQAVLPPLRRKLNVWGARQDTLVHFDGPMSVLDPVEVRARSLPEMMTEPLEQPERSVFEAEEVAPAEFVDFLKRNDLAVIVSRNVTTRDSADRQQPVNLYVEDAPETIADTGSGQLYPVQYLQIFQGDMIRINAHAGVPTGEAPDVPPQNYSPGRRVLPRPLHATSHLNLHSSAIAKGAALTEEFANSAVKVAADGSVAAFVPANRALSWHLTDSEATPLVSERYWLTFQPGEIRVCGSCHGVDSEDQLGRTAPTNEPEALGQLLRHWKTQLAASIFGDGFESL